MHEVIRQRRTHEIRDIKQGAPEYLSAENDTEYFFWIVENMKSSFRDWDVPSLIVE